MHKLDLLFAGSGEFGLPTLRSLAQAGHNLVCIYSQPDRPAGRGRKLAPTPVAQFALEQNLSLTRTDDLNKESLPAVDLLIVIAFGQKISDAVTRHARLGSINLHASRLPKYRGASPINSAILNGETVTGNSIIRLAQKMDAGAVLAMSELKIGDTETAGELHDRLAEAGAPLMLQTVEQLATNRAIETPQDESQATKAPKLKRESTRIDWNQSAERIANQIRALYPWPGCRVRLVSSENVELARLTLVRAKSGMSDSPMGSSASDSPAGTINQDGRIIAAGTPLQILEIHPEGKRPMPLLNYLNGHPWPPGARLESVL